MIRTDAVIASRLKPPLSSGKRSEMRPSLGGRNKQHGQCHRHRRRFAVPGRVLGGMAAAGAFLPAALRASAARAASGPVKIGVINTFSKLAKLGDDNYNGMALYLDQIGRRADVSGAHPSPLQSRE